MLLPPTSYKRINQLVKYYNYGLKLKVFKNIINKAIKLNILSMHIFYIYIKIIFVICFLFY